jgi:transcriptional regulator with XRE-family HTH domain
MDMDSKARFRALRETIGITQAQAAETFGVQPRAVRRWESPTAPQLPPVGVLEEMERMADERARAIESTVKATERFIAEAVENVEGHKVEEVSLPYWSSQAAYDEWHPAKPEDYRRVNSISRGVADALRSRGLNVKWLLDRAEAVN